MPYRRFVWLYEVLQMVLLIASVTGRPTPQTSMFPCFSDICDRKGYYVCSETERRCQECSMFYSDTCGTEQQPAGCYGYCAESLNQSTQEELKTAQARLATANDELRQLNKSNSDIRALITELHISISDQKTQNQEINETLQETKESFEKSEAQILLLKSKVDEAIDSSKWKIIGLSIGFCLSVLLAIVLVIYTFRKAKCCPSRRKPEKEIRMSELTEDGTDPNIDENANQPKGETATATTTNADGICKEAGENHEQQNGSYEDPIENGEDTEGDYEKPGDNQDKTNVTEKRLTPESSNPSLSELTISGKGCG